MTRPRRFLLSRLPDAAPGPEVVVRQVFWRLGDGWVLRLRREGPAGVPSRDTLTVCGPGAVEWTLPLDAGPPNGTAGAGGAAGTGAAGAAGAGAAGAGAAGAGAAGPETGAAGVGAAGTGAAGAAGVGAAGTGAAGAAGAAVAGRVDAVAALWRAGAGHRVLFLRRRYRLAGRGWDVDEYHWENEGLILARADGPGPPGAVRDVTGEPAYDDENLAYAPFTTWAAPSR